MKAKEFIANYHRLSMPLKNFILQQEALLSDEHFESLLKHISKLIEDTQDELLKKPAGPLRAKYFQELIDIEVEAASSIKTSCKASCGACCHVEVEVTYDEAQALVQQLENQKLVSGRPVDYARLLSQASRKRNDLTWIQKPRIENRCVFLNDDQNCSIYEVRPGTCRKHSVTSPASLCGDPSAPQEIRYIPRADIIISAMIDLEGTRFGSMSKMILDAVLTSTTPIQLPLKDTQQIKEFDEVTATYALDNDF